jgi:hypothetical protein
MQVVLGLNCKERCMVEATSRLTGGEERSTMICQLIPSAVPNCKLSLSFKQVCTNLSLCRFIWGSNHASRMMCQEIVSIRQEMSGNVRIGTSGHVRIHQEMSGCIKKSCQEILRCVRKCQNTPGNIRKSCREMSGCAIIIKKWEIRTAWLLHSLAG